MTRLLRKKYVGSNPIRVKAGRLVCKACMIFSVCFGTSCCVGNSSVKVSYFKLYILNFVFARTIYD